MTEPVDNLPSVPNYTLERLIGAGNAGQVYQARHTPSGQPVALRLIPAAALASKDIAERLTSELRAALGLRNPNIIETYTTGQVDGRPFIVMELAEGGSLRTMLRGRAQIGPLSLDRCLELASQIAAALIYAHGLNYVHGAIKPENLLFGRVPSAGEPPQLKLSDFGISWLPDALAEGATVVTSPSAPYLSPEQCQGLPANEQSDIYSFGVVLYELITGLPPFPVETLTEAIQRHVFVAPPSFAELRPGVPATLEALVMRCLAKQPEDRFASATDLAMALELARAELPAPVVQPLPAPDAPTIAGRNVDVLAAPIDATVIEPVRAAPDVVPTPIDATVISPAPEVVPDATAPPISADATVISPAAEVAPAPTDPTVVAPAPEVVQAAEPQRGSADETVIGPVPVVVAPVPAVAAPVAPAVEPAVADFAETVPPVAAAQPRPTPPVVATPVPALVAAGPPPPLPIAPPMQSLPQVQVFDTQGRQVDLVPLTGDGLAVGSGSERDLVLQGEGVADDHVFIDFDGKQVTISDNGSATGTQIGGSRLQPGFRQVWEPAALVRLGPFWLRMVPALPVNATVMGVAIPRATPARPITSAAIPGPTAVPSTPTIGVPIVAPIPGSSGMPLANQSPPPPVLQGNQMSTAQGPQVRQGVAQPQPQGGVSPTDPPLNNPVSTDRLRAELEQDTLQLTPGQTSVLRMTLYNQGNQVDHLKVSVEGVPEAWVQSPPPVQLLPGRSQPTALSVNVPRTPESRAGAYPVTVYGRSTSIANEAAVTQAQWTVLPFTDTTLELKPRRAEGWRSAGYSLALTNNGNQKIRYQLTGEDDEQALEYGIPPEPIELEPGASFKKKVIVRGQLIPLGSGQQRSFTIYAKPDKKGDQQSAPAQFVQRALLPFWVIPLILVGLIALVAWAIQPPEIVASINPAPQIEGEPATLKWETKNARQVLILPLNVTAEPSSGQFAFDNAAAIPADLRVEASTLFGVQRTAVPTVFVLSPTPLPSPTPIPPTLTPEPTLAPLPTLAPTEVPPPTAPPLPPPTEVPPPTPTSPPIEQLLTISDCRAGVRVIITGSGPAREPYLLFFGRRAVAGGSVAADGRFQTSLLIGKERPGTYPVTVRQRLSDRPFLIQTYRLDNNDPVILPPNTVTAPVNIFCTVLPADLTPTVGPAQPFLP